MGELALETVTCVTVGSYYEPRPSGWSPLPVLTKVGAGETLKIREEISELKSNVPIDAAFSALPLPMVGVAAEMIILLTGDERTGLAEVPYQNHPLSLLEVDGVRRVEALGPNSLNLLFYGNRDAVSAKFLREYGAERKEALLDFAETVGARHVLLIGLPLFMHAIAWSFAKGEDKRQVALMAPTKGSIFQIIAGSIQMPGTQPVR